MRAMLRTRKRRTELDLAELVITCSGYLLARMQGAETPHEEKLKIALDVICKALSRIVINQTQANHQHIFNVVESKPIEGKPNEAYLQITREPTGDLSRLGEI